QCANANMADAFRLISIRRGYDPRDFCLVAFGGAGSVHAAHLARELDIPAVVGPPYPGITSALGCLLLVPPPSAASSSTCGTISPAPTSLRLTAPAAPRSKPSSTGWRMKRENDSPSR